MKKSELEKIYRKVAKEVDFEVDFKEDPAHKGWMPKLRPNDYKCKIVHGFTKKAAVTLTVGPKGVVDMETLKLAGDYALVCFGGKKESAVYCSSSSLGRGKL